MQHSRPTPVATSNTSYIYITTKPLKSIQYLIKFFIYVNPNQAITLKDIPALATSATISSFLKNASFIIQEAFLAIAVYYDFTLFFSLQANHSLHMHRNTYSTQ
jgi:hypothetical protein